MIAALTGRLLEKRPNRIVLDVHGVGYEVHVPLSTFYQMSELGDEITLQIHTHVREETLALFGFSSDLELVVFEHLISVSGVGPRLALTALSGLEPPVLVRAVRNGDIASLMGIPGVGKKTAERLVLELKDRLPVSESVSQPDEAASTGTDDLRGDVLSALLNLGYHRPLAEKAISVSLEAGEIESFEHALRQALRELSR